MKKLMTALLSAAMLSTLFSGCGTAENMPAASADSADKLKIVTTVFPAYDWTREIIGQEAENIDLTLLMKNGTDLHSYQPSAEDLAAITGADVFVYVGGHSDTWVADALRNESNPHRIIINLFDVLRDTLKPLVPSEGMEDHHDHDHDHDDHDDHDHDDHDHDDHDHDDHDHDDHNHDDHDDHDHDDHDDHDHDDHDDHGHRHEEENDEHVWLSLPRAAAAVRTIAEQLAEADPSHADTYLSNAKQYMTALEELDLDYRDVVAAGAVDTLVFADRFPFFYLADDYGLNYYAAFTGCSAESEASFETVAVLAHRIDELGLQNVITIENRAHKIPETVIESTKSKAQRILTLNSLQSVTSEQLNNNTTYLEIMRSNLDVLRTALQ